MTTTKKRANHKPKVSDEVPPQDPTLKVQVYHDTDPDTADQGVTYMHCAKCLEEWKDLFRFATSPKGYARHQVALTKDGVQVWCIRHECNITVMRLRAVRKEEE